MVFPKLDARFAAANPEVRDSHPLRQLAETALLGEPAVAPGEPAAAPSEGNASRQFAPVFKGLSAAASGAGHS
jgi:hypothetical protein